MPQDHLQDRLDHLTRVGVDLGRLTEHARHTLREISDEEFNSLLSIRKLLKHENRSGCVEKCDEFIVLCV
jgi:hypothetical protein